MKTMRHIYIKGIMAAVALMSLASCVKDDLYDPGVGPDPGHPSTLVIQPDYFDASLEAVISPTWRLSVNGGDESFDTDEAQLKMSVPLGTVNLLAHSLPEGFSFDGNVASVNPVGGTKAAGEVEPQPGYLFAGCKEVRVTEKGEQTVTMPMKQLVRRLNFKIYENSGEGDGDIYVESAEATLSGVATAVDMTTGELLSGAATVSGTFETSGIEHSVFFRVLGVVPVERQSLTVELTWSNGDKQTIVDDLSDIIDSDTTDIQIFESEVTPPVNGEVGGELSPWETVDGGGGDAI